MSSSFVPQLHLHSPPLSPIMSVPLPSNLSSFLQIVIDLSSTDQMVCSSVSGGHGVCQRGSVLRAPKTATTMGTHMVLRGVKTEPQGSPDWHSSPGDHTSMGTQTALSCLSQKPSELKVGLGREGNPGSPHFTLQS